MIAYVYLFSFFLGFLFFFSVGKKYGTNWDNCLPLTGFCNTNGQWLPVILTDPHPWWFNVKSRYSNPQQRSNICTTGNDGEKHRNTSSILEILFIPVLSFLGLPCPTQNRRTVTKCLHHPIPTIGTLNQARTSCRGDAGWEQFILGIFTLKEQSRRTYMDVYPRQKTGFCMFWPIPVWSFHWKRKSELCRPVQYAFWWAGGPKGLNLTLLGFNGIQQIFHIPKTVAWFLERCRSCSPKSGDWTYIDKIWWTHNTCPNQWPGLTATKDCSPLS